MHLYLIHLDIRFDTNLILVCYTRIYFVKLNSTRPSQQQSISLWQNFFNTTFPDKIINANFIFNSSLQTSPLVYTFLKSPSCVFPHNCVISVHTFRKQVKDSQHCFWGRDVWIHYSSPDVSAHIAINRYCTW